MAYPQFIDTARRFRAGEEGWLNGIYVLEENRGRTVFAPHQLSPQAGLRQEEMRHPRGDQESSGSFGIRYEGARERRVCTSSSPVPTITKWAATGTESADCQNRAKWRV